MRGALARVYRVVYDAFDHLARDDGWAMASHLALSGLMAIFPFLIFVAALASFIGHAQLAESVTEMIFQAWPEEIATPIANEVRYVLTAPRRGSILTISVLVTIFLASNGVEAVRIGLNRAYRASEERSILFLRAQSIFFVLIGALLCIAIAVFGLLGPLLWTLAERALPALADYRASYYATRYLLLGLVLGAGLVAAHLWLPARRPPEPRIWPGILATLVLWWVATAVFSTYLEDFANYAITYAGLASLVAAIFYLYLMGVILLFGAEFNGALSRELGEEPADAVEVTPPEVTMPKRRKRPKRQWRRRRFRFRRGAAPPPE